MPALSIIVPVYRVEKYLHRCIDSILAQTFSDFELILIDDGSPDRCGEICDEYAGKDERVIVIHQKNKGVSAARNAGLDIARGEYIGFVDSDDWIEPEMYEHMLSIAENGYEIVSVGANTANGGSQSTILVLDSEFNRKELLLELIAQPNRIGGSACNKLFMKKVLSNVRFPEGFSMCEDRIFLFGAFSNTNRCRSVSQVYYTIESREGSALRSNSIMPLFNIILADNKLLNLYRTYQPGMLSSAIDKYMQECEYYISQIRKLGKQKGMPYKKYVMKIKASMVMELAKGLIEGQISKTKLHAYGGAILR